MFQAIAAVIMLPDDEGEQRGLHTIGLPAEPAIPIFPAVEIVRGKNDEPTIRQARREVVIVGVVSLDDIFGHAPAAMLADDDGPPFPQFDIFRHQQDAPGEHVWPHVKDHFIADPLVGVVDLPRSRVERRIRFIESAKNLFRKVLAVPPGPSVNLSGDIVL